MAGKQVTELDALPSFTDTSLLPVHNGAGLKKGTLTQLASYLGTKFSNPNLLINPDFKINQRGVTSYTSNGYTVDRWKINSGTVNASSSGITVTLNSEGQFIQQFENTLSGTHTATIKVTSITGDCVLSIGTHSLQLNKAGTFTITENGSISGISLYKNTAGTCTINVEYIKLEQGSVATPFVAPNLAEEFVKCQRYYYKFKVLKYGVIPPGKAWVDEIIAKPFRTKPTVEIDKTFNISTSSVENKIEKIGDMYVISVRATSNSNAQSQYGLEALVSIDAEIY